MQESRRRIEHHIEDVRPSAPAATSCQMKNIARITWFDYISSDEGSKGLIGKLITRLIARAAFCLLPAKSNHSKLDLLCS